MEEVLKVLSAGGDVGTYILIFALWKIDTRLRAVEFKLNVG